jgi:glycosyltransferase involved in cell wall biosynthesis
VPFLRFSLIVCMRVLALASYPIEAACTRYRISQFVGPLKEHGIDVTLHPLLDGRAFAELYRPAALPRTAIALVGAMLRRVEDILNAHKFDAVFVQREAMLIGPPLVEWLAMRMGRCPMVLDLDDATYVSYRSPTYGRLGSALKWFGKTDDLIRWAQIVTCGNRSIAAYVTAQGKPAMVIPTVVDLDLFTPKAELELGEIPTLGWVGTHSTYPFLESVYPALQQLARTHRFRLKVVGAGKETISIPGVEVESLSWNLEREVEDFRSFDVGLYPMLEDDWSVAKSGFKAIQYMSVGVPYVTTPVGTCVEIGEAGTTHLFAGSQDEWCAALSGLINDSDLRRRMGAAGRQHALQNYGLPEQTEKLAQALKLACLDSVKV